MPTKIEKDEITGQTTTGHEWDGIKELNTPLPRWWLTVWYVCIAWAVVYWVLYPAWPLIHGYTHGILGYSTRMALVQDMKTAEAAQAGYIKQIEATPVTEIPKNPKLLEFALAGGRSAFGNNCAPCHGSGAQGGHGYPNLNDDDWLWGGTIADIYTTIQHGIRSPTDPDTRQNDMPRFLADGILKADQVNDVAEYVLSLTNRSTEPAAAKRGEKIFTDNCVACHGQRGIGNPQLGAPRLSDQIWLYGGDKAAIVQTVSYAHRGVMPAWKGRLDDATIKELTIYVHSLGGGQ